LDCDCALPTHFKRYCIPLMHPLKKDMNKGQIGNLVGFDSKDCTMIRPHVVKFQ
jgi:hypothetical protein